MCHHTLHQLPVDGRVVGRLLQDGLQQGGDVVPAGGVAVPQYEGKDVVTQHLYRLVTQRHRQQVHQLRHVEEELLHRHPVHEGEEGGQEGEEGLAAGVGGGGDQVQVWHEVVESVVELPVVQDGVQRQSLGVQLWAPDHVVGQARHVPQYVEEGGGEPPVGGGQVRPCRCGHHANTHLLLGLSQRLDLVMRKSELW